MRKSLKTVIYFFICFSIIMSACSVENKEGSMEENSNGYQITEINGEVSIVKMNSFSEEKEGSLVEISDSKYINILKKAINEASKELGIVDMVDPDYKVNLGNISYFLWLNEESGTLMNLEDTHTIYTITMDSVKELNEMITSIYVD